MERLQRRHEGLGRHTLDKQSTQRCKPCLVPMNERTQRRHNDHPRPLHLLYLFRLHQRRAQGYAKGQATESQVMKTWQTIVFLNKCQLVPVHAVFKEERASMHASHVQYPLTNNNCICHYTKQVYSFRKGCSRLSFVYLDGESGNISGT